ncbi:MAG TPA: substrate-binding domain-containing protein [Vineibacter sp.]|nr:substrate-binding domain-containing protein [Vineibacter sp.]
MHRVRFRAALLALSVMATPATALAADITVLSAGALEAGLPALAERFSKANNHTIRVEIATPPAIRQRLLAGERADVVIVPPAVLEDKAIAPRLDQATARVIGRAGVGIAVHVDAPAPRIDSADAVKAALLAADSVVYNTASTGTYFVKLIDRLGIADAVKAKATIYASGQQVMAHVAKGTKDRSALGIGPLTEIHLYVGKGVRLVGPLPADIQNHTSYVAVVMAGGTAPAVAADFIAFLASAPSLAAFAATGLEPASR